MGRSRSPERRRHRSRSPRRRDERDDKGRGGRDADRGKDRRDRSPERDRKRRDRSRSRSRDRKHSRSDRDRDGHRDKDRGRDRPRKGEEEEEEEGAIAPVKKQPISLEDLVKKKTVEAEEAAKPVFLTKEQRAAAALQKRQEEVAAQRAQADEARRGMHNPFASSGGGGGSGMPPPPPPGRYGNRVSGRDDFYDRRGGRNDRGRGGRDDPRVDPKYAGMSKEERDRQKEIDDIKAQYLGLKEKKKRVVRASEKFRFNFDWDAAEDTSRDSNPLYENPHEAALLFGRGLRAGIDRREQKKSAVQMEGDMRRKMLEAQGLTETREEREADKAKQLKAINKYDAQLMKVDQHWSEKALKDMTERDWRIFREDYNIAFKGGKVPNPMRSWKESELPPSVLRAVEKVGYKKPSPIQMASIPLGLLQRDVIGIAKTGSGKTAAFVLPMLTYISKLPPMTEEIEADGPYSIVMAPTRELAQQIEEETVKFCQFMNYRVASIVGGQSIEEQGFKLRKGCEIVIGTPGRIVDCLDRRYAVLNQCNYVVLDEADRMIDMGFEPQVMAVLDAMPSSNLKPENEEDELVPGFVYRTTYMFSATMPPAVEKLARKYLRNPAVVTIGTVGKVTDTITQRCRFCKDGDKVRLLGEELEVLGDDLTAIVFTNTKRTCDFVSKTLEKEGWRCTIMHGSKTQDQREASLEGFKKKRFNILIATDVAGRGIDVPDVALVVNYDMPETIDQYTHRIGRTGRAGKQGEAVAFLTGGDTDIYYDLNQMLKSCGATIPPELARHEATRNKPEAKTHGPGGGKGKSSVFDGLFK